MCGRYSLAPGRAEVEALLAALPPASAPVRLGEIYPTATALVLGREAAPWEGGAAWFSAWPVLEDAWAAGGRPLAMTWGFERPGASGVVINARAETALSRPMFRRALLERPAAIPSSAFYEWRPTEGGKKKEKLRFAPPGGGLIWLGGLWEPAAAGARFVILTRAASPDVAPYHARMPVIIPAGELGAWLSGQGRREALAAPPPRLEVSGDPRAAEP